MRRRFAIEVKGIVQGVGFRPFVYALAQFENLSGWVYNHSAGVAIEIEGEDEACRDFLRRLESDAPALAVVEHVEYCPVDLHEDSGFMIRESEAGAHDTLISPDMGICAQCLAELRDPENRRYRYAFTNCTNCGPRFTIICDLPYDRKETTMRTFPLCEDCASEYHDPSNRRFHAQPNACPVCGPALVFLDREAHIVAGDPIFLAREALKRGEIIAVKGLGGYHLACDAENESAVRTLRQRKYRFDKPFALMMPDLATVRLFCHCGEAEAVLLTSQRRPIVLLKKDSAGRQLPQDIAPGNARFGVMLPYTPLHYLLLEGHTALVMTSGNLSDEPIFYEDEEAFAGLKRIADGFLTHNRGIFRRCDDSVVVFAADAPRMIRRSRGYAPQPLKLIDCGKNILAVGAEQKNTFCLTRRGQAFLSQHSGDLDNLPTLRGYEKEIDYFIRMFHSKPALLAYDLHPGYLSTNYAMNYAKEIPRLGVQHHHAHLAAVLAEHQLWENPAIGLIYDGTGYGPDGLLWGGEVLVGDCLTYTRTASLLPFALPGGTQAIHEPWRVAMSVLYEAMGEQELREASPEGLFPEGWQTLLDAMKKGFNAPLSSGMGRLFDAVAALVGIGRVVHYEGQAAVELEQILDPLAEGSYTFTFVEEAGILHADWRPVIREVLRDLQHGVAREVVATRFHRSVVALSLHLAERERERSGLNLLALSGGCWQNIYLLEMTKDALEQAGFQVLLPSQIPCNDGGIAYGQAAVAAMNVIKERF